MSDAAPRNPTGPSPEDQPEQSIGAEEIASLNADIEELAANIMLADPALGFTFTKEVTDEAGRLVTLSQSHLQAPARLNAALAEAGKQPVAATNDSEVIVKFPAQQLPDGKKMRRVVSWSVYHAKKEDSQGHIVTDQFEVYDDNGQRLPSDVEAEAARAARASIEDTSDAGQHAAELRALGVSSVEQAMGDTLPPPTREQYQLIADGLQFLSKTLGQPQA